MEAASLKGNSEKLIAWLTNNKIKVLNVAGPRLSKDPKIYDATMRLLKAALSGVLTPTDCI